jgi:large conductance mechanosensitive channel
MAKKGLVSEFKDFIAGGNMLELAVAVILGGAIGAVIKAFTENVMMQIVAAIFGKPNFDDVGFRLGSKEFTDEATKVVHKGAFIGLGSVITALISLVMTGLVLFAIIKAYNNMKAAKAASEPAPGPSEVDLLTEIRDSLKSRT